MMVTDRKMMINKSTLKYMLGELPFTAEVYWQFRQGGRPLSKNFSMQRTRKQLPDWVSQASRHLETIQPTNTRRVLLFTTLRYWIEHATLMGVTIAGMGHDVTLAFLPYANWHSPVNRFDLRRHNAYIKHILKGAEPLLKTVSLLDVKTSQEKFPEHLSRAIDEISTRDVQYTLQIEDIDKNSALYHLRLERNREAARKALVYLQENRPDILITPNGSILEMGIIFQVARQLEIPVVTYEFGEQRDRIWLAYNDEVMQQNTNEMWAARQDSVLSSTQQEQIQALFVSRKHADLWENFSRRWQGLPSQGGEKVRQELNLDERPVVLLAANVIGDSLTLGRQIFTPSMTSWLKRTIMDFAQRSDVQLIIRIHPGERYTQGPSVADIINQNLAEIPEHIHIIAANDPVNTYDLIDIADLGLVYTTTVGLEMAMSGVPVIVIGQTHYRGKGFTLDPSSWDEYSKLIDQTLSGTGTHRLTKKKVEQAWIYAYKFFFEYPSPFPWHLLHFWDELETWSVEKVLSTEGQALYENTFQHLLGKPRNWLKPIQGEMYSDTKRAGTNGMVKTK